jgi:hypothetical protein
LDTVGSEEVVRPVILDGLRHVMIVDDVAANRTILERNLNSWGCG